MLRLALALVAFASAYDSSDPSAATTAHVASDATSSTLASKINGAACATGEFIDQVAPSTKAFVENLPDATMNALAQMKTAAEDGIAHVQNMDALAHLKTAAEDGIAHVQNMDTLAHLKTAAEDGLAHVQNKTTDTVDSLIDNLPDELKGRVADWPADVKYLYVPGTVASLVLLFVGLYTIRLMRVVFRFLFGRSKQPRGRSAQQLFRTLRLTMHMDVFKTTKFVDTLFKSRSPKRAWQITGVSALEALRANKKAARVVVRDRFVAADADGNGSLDADEMIALVESLIEEFGAATKLRVLKENVPAFVAFHDDNGDGKLDADEFANTAFWDILDQAYAVADRCGFDDVKEQVAAQQAAKQGAQ